MTRQNISIGTTAHDGTGDTLRSAGTKINANFVEIYQRIGGDSDALSSQITFEDSAVVFEGSVADGFETRLVAVNPTADRVVQIPNSTGIIVLDTNTQTLTNKTIVQPTIYRPIVQQSINDSSGNEFIKLTRTASAVNEITIANNSTTNSPSISASGDDTNVNLTLNSKGTGSVVTRKSAYNTITHASGSISSLATYIKLQGNGTLANGTTQGEFKIFTFEKQGATTNSTVTLTTGSVASFTVDSSTSAFCIWDGGRWFKI